MNPTFLTLLILSTPIVAALQDGDLRLAGGIQPNEGRVEVYYHGEWGTVCDDNWSMQAGNVVCKQLGYDRAEKVSYSAAYGPGSGQIWIDEINCQGIEKSVTECNHNYWGENDCAHSEDAGVECARRQVTKPAALPIRLSCPLYTIGGTCKVCPGKRGPSPGECSLQTAVEGIVQAYNGEKWVALGGNGWNLKAASVACGELGFPVATKVPSLQELWPNVDPQVCQRGGRCGPAEVSENNEYRRALLRTMVSGLQCAGNERTIRDCYAADFGEVTSSGEINVATVRCGFVPHSSCAANSSNEMYRLRGGAMPWGGRVEVRIDGQWGTICDSQWDALDGNVVCRSLGYGTVKTPYYGAQYGRGVGKIHFTELRCTGGEILLSSCPNKGGVTADSCGHQRDAGVECNVPSSQCWDRYSRLYEERDLQGAVVQSFVEVRGSSGWGALCYDEKFEFDVGHAVCRETKEMFSYRMRNVSTRNYSGYRYKGSIKCGPSAVSLSECVLQLSSLPRCPNGELVVDCSAGLPDLVPDLAAFENSLRNHPYVDRQPMYYLGCALEEGCLSASAAGKPSNHQRALLRFDSQTMNWGKADFLSNLQPSQWIWHSCHNHYHSYKGFSQYDILNLAGEKVADGAKVSFCLEDSTCATGGTPRYKCGAGNQGITANCGDVYASYLDCQWIDVTDVPPGQYTVRLHDNPLKFVPESDHLNNVATCRIEYYPWFYINVISCSLSDH